MEEFGKERAGIINRAQGQVTDAQGELEALRRLIKLKTVELKRLRRLAQEVLLQRSDVETFLLSSLYKVMACTVCILEDHLLHTVHYFQPYLTLHAGLCLW